MADLSETEIRNAQYACEALGIEYAEIVDTKDFARLREVFAEDATFVMPSAPGQPIRGIDNIIAAFAARPRNRLTHHLVTNTRIRVETPDTAVGTSRVLLYTTDESEPVTPEGRKAAPKQMMGTYYDRFVRTKNGWRFSERRGTITLHT